MVYLGYPSVVSLAEFSTMARYQLSKPLSSYDTRTYGVLYTAAHIQCENFRVLSATVTMGIVIRVRA